MLSRIVFLFLLWTWISLEAASLAKNNTQKKPGRKSAKCGRLEKRSICGPELDCTLRGLPPSFKSRYQFCRDQKTSRCFRKEGYARNGKRCVKAEECRPPEPQVKPKCRSRETFGFCAFERHCKHDGELNPYDWNPETCDYGCTCKRNYTRSLDGKKCLRECP